MLNTSTGEPVRDASLVLVRITNNSRLDAGKEHFDLGGPRIHLRRPCGRRLELFEMNPPALAKSQEPPAVTFTGSLLTLPALSLNLGERFKLLISLPAREPPLTARPT